MSKYELILMSDRLPVVLKSADWPVVAEGDGYRDLVDGAAVLAKISVRRHENRVVVYGESGCHIRQRRRKPDSGFRHYAGVIAEVSDVMDAVRSVANRLITRARKVYHEQSPNVIKSVRSAQERCIANLAEDLE